MPRRVEWIQKRGPAREQAPRAGKEKHCALPIQIFLIAGGGAVLMNKPSSALAHLPPHLREICTILAAGLMRLRSRTEDDIARDLKVYGESSLHFRTDLSGHANRTNRRPA